MKLRERDRQTVRERERGRERERERETDREREGGRQETGVTNLFLGVLTGMHAHCSVTPLL